VDGQTDRQTDKGKGLALSVFMLKHIIFANN